MKNQTRTRITAATAIVAAVSLIIGVAIWAKTPVLTLVMKDRLSGEIYFEHQLDEDGAFSVSYIHSVNKSEVEEYYRWQDGTLLLYRGRYHHFGAGVATELRPGEELFYDEDGFMVIDKMHWPLDNLSYRVGTVSDHVLHIGAQSWHLKELAPELSSVVFEIYQTSRY